MNKKVSFDPSLYPRVYSMRPLYKILHVMAGPFVVNLIYPHIHANPSKALLDSTFILILISIASLRNVFSKTILYSDRIVYTNLFFKREMRRDEVVGLSLVGNGRVIDSALIYKNNAQAPFIVSDCIKKDAAWEAWMNAGPNPDA